MKLDRNRKHTECERNFCCTKGKKHDEQKHRNEMAIFRLTFNVIFVAKSNFLAIFMCNHIQQNRKQFMNLYLFVRSCISSRSMNNR